MMKMKYVVQKVVNCESKFNKNSEVEANVTDPGIGVRHLQSLLLAFCVFCGYLQRVNLSVTIVAMTNIEKPAASRQENGFPTYDWNEDTQSYLHAAFFLGYFVMNFPAAYLGVFFNLKMLLFISFLMNGLLTCSTPYVINLRYNGTNKFLLQAEEFVGAGNWRAFAVLRALQGMIQAFMFPTIHAISAKWSPPNERGRLIGFIMSGVPLGTMIALAGSGLLASNPYLGWPSVFYVSGSITLVWVFFWGWFGSSSPSEHATISFEEHNYICSQLPPENAKSERKVPWLDILTSLHVWAIIVVHTTHNWGFWLLLSEMPTFLNAVSGFNIKSDGYLSSTPYIAMWLIQFPVMYLADRLNQRGITSLTVSRKIWSSIGVWGGAAGLIVLGYFDNNVTAAVILYVISVGIGCCCNVGFNINHMDLAPNYAGILMGLSNTIAATGGFCAPFIVDTFVDDITSVAEWRKVFYIGAGILFFGNSFFVIFASGKTQRWNNKYITFQ